jgi:hypothetical protein
MPITGVESPVHLVASHMQAVARLDQREALEAVAENPLNATFASYPSEESILIAGYPKNIARLCNYYKGIPCIFHVYCNYCTHPGIDAPHYLAIFCGQSAS